MCDYCDCGCGDRQCDHGCLCACCKELLEDCGALATAAFDWELNWVALAAPGARLWLRTCAYEVRLRMGKRMEDGLAVIVDTFHTEDAVLRAAFYCVFSTSPCA